MLESIQNGDIETAQFVIHSKEWTDNAGTPRGTLKITEGKYDTIFVSNKLILGNHERRGLAQLIEMGLAAEGTKVDGKTIASIIHKVPYKSHTRF